MVAMREACKVRALNKKDRFLKPQTEKDFFTLFYYFVVCISFQCVCSVRVGGKHIHAMACMWW